jgi:PKD repeat protein
MNNILVLLSFILAFNIANAQVREKCATMYADSVLRATTQGMPTLNDFEQWLQNEIAVYNANNANNANSRGGRQVYTIPVIVHVIHNGEAVGSGRNISQAQVNSQIAVLNEDFRRLNTDAANTLSQFQPVAADVEIEFCLARVDPNGNLLAEPGIHRYNGGQATWSNTTTIDNTLKPATIWDPNRYFNMWTVDFGNNGLLGYAQFPQGSGLAGMPGGTQNAQSDGIVMYYRAFGRVGNVQSPYNRGRTTTHEAGHWLGLRHIWGDGGCTQDDFCADTPPSDASSSGCNLSRQSCGGLNMVQNYMDYSNDACMNIFTQNQKTRMRTTLTVAVRRASLLTSNVCQVINPIPVSGKVRDAVTLQGIPNAKVRFVGNGFSYTATCNAQGDYSFTNIGAGTYTMYAGQWGYMTKQVVNINVQAGITPINVDLDAGYYDDFVLEFGWTKTSTATTGAWVRDKPIGTTFNNVQCAPGADVTNDFGEDAYVTGNGGGSAGTDDVDDGVVTLTSPVFNLANSNDPRVHYSAWFYNAGGNGTPDDTMKVRLSNGQQTVNLEIIRNNIQWAQRSFRIRDFLTPTANMTIQFIAMDLPGNGHLVEAGVDLFRITDTTAIISNPPVANFNANVQSGCAPLTVNFSDVSTNAPTSWSWQFPGGTPATSSVQNPTVTYNTPGIYAVTLTATNSVGNNTKTEQAFITIQPTVADFTSDITAGCPGLRATFTDITTCPQGGKQWLFPGGSPASSTSASPQVVYNTLGQFDVTLIVNGDTMTKTNYINTTAGGTITVLNENFESNSFATNGWTVENPDNSFAWQILATAGNTAGTRSAGINLFDYNTIGQRDRLVSRTLDLSNVTNTTLTFKHAHRRYAAQGQSPANRDSLIVYVSANNGSSWTRVLAAGENGQGSFATNTTVQVAFVPQVAADWCFSGTTGSPCFTINLGAYDGNPNVKIRFESYNDSGNYIYLDDIIVSGNCVTTPNYPIANFDADVTEGCGSLTVQFSDQSANNPTSWSWTFPGGNPASSADQNPLVTYAAPGTYPVTLRVFNTFGSDSFTVVDYVTVYSIPGVSFAAQNVSCYGWNNGSIVASISNATAPFAFSWSNGATTADIQNLSPSAYSVSVTDANGCSASSQTSISEPDSLSVSYSKIDSDCGQNTGEIILSVTGGTMPYQYLWNNNATTNSLSNVPAGNYEAIVSDSYNCTYAVEIEITNPDAPVFIITSSDVSCFGGNNGAVSVATTGGTPPYSYSWSNGATSDSLNGLNAGPYLLTVTDDRGCFAFGSVAVEQPDSLELDFAITNVLCKQKTGIVNVSVTSGGVPPFTFNWSNGFLGNPNSLLEPGTYTVTVTDSSGCFTIAIATVTRIDTFRINTTSVADHVVTPDGDGEATVTMLNGTPPFVILWSDGQTTATATGLSAGVYTVNVEDANGCEATDTIEVLLTLSAPTLTDAQIKVYPNPTSGKLTIELLGNFNNVSVSITDILGRKILNQHIEQRTDHNINLDLNGNANGIYVLEFTTAQGKIQKRILLRGN